MKIRAGPQEYPELIPLSRGPAPGQLGEPHDRSSPGFYTSLGKKLVWAPTYTLFYSSVGVVFCVWNAGVEI